jgi:hypothetical protein
VRGGTFGSRALVTSSSSGALSPGGEPSTSGCVPPAEPRARAAARLRARALPPAARPSRRVRCAWRGACGTATVRAWRADLAGLRREEDGRVVAVVTQEQPALNPFSPAAFFKTIDVRASHRAARARTTPEPRGAAFAPLRAL